MTGFKTFHHISADVEQQQLTDAGIICNRKAAGNAYRRSVWGGGGGDSMFRGPMEVISPTTVIGRTTTYGTSAIHYNPFPQFHLIVKIRYG